MPAPIAKGLIISFSLLFAAGAALYENPQVRQWVDESRRKVAVALHSLGDELAPQQSDEREQRRRDASTREDESAEAAERRRRARQEILERGRMMEERRRAAAEEQQQQPNQGKGKSMSFDDLVDKDGSLKKEEAEPEAEAPIATTTAAEPNFQGGLRHRGASTSESSFNAAAALGATVANPFVDENFVDRFGSWEEARWAAEKESQSRSPTPTLASPPVPPKPAAYQPQTLLIDTTDVVSNHPSEQLVSLTPTTTASSAAADLAELDQGDRRPQAPSPESYLSVDEWAQEQSVHQSFHSPQQSLADAFVHTQQPHINAAVTGEGSVADSVEHASQAGTEDVDVMSEFEDGINTPSTWTEVGSVASE